MPIRTAASKENLEKNTKTNVVRTALRTLVSICVMLFLSFIYEFKLCYSIGEEKKKKVEDWKTPKGLPVILQ